MVTRDQMRAALAHLGVCSDTLSAAERHTLDQDGYLLLPGILSPPEVHAAADRLDAILSAEGSDAGSEVGRQEMKVERVCDLVNKGAVFDVCFYHPRVLAAIEHVIGPRFKLSSLNGRVVLPGGGPQPLHEDWHMAAVPGDYYACNSLWMLDDFTATNGATRVVPASHRWNQTSGDALDDPAGPHPDEVLLLGQAGTVVIFNAHLWHGGTLNQGSSRRRAVLSFFCWPGQRQQQNQRALLRAETSARLSAAARLVLDLD
jgi:ectoine hydroxylase-related dioxygenase (phytanoyl-CoA dioxygenase family)